MKSLNLVVLRCADVERSRAFYEILGMTFSKHRHGDGPEHYACEDERGVLELYPLMGEGTHDQTGLGFAITDLQGRFDVFNHAGWSPKPIQRTQWGRSFVVRDPDQRRVEISEKRDGSTLPPG